MSKDERLPSVRVEIEGVVSSELDAPNVEPGTGSSPSWAAAATLAVLVAMGAILILFTAGTGEQLEDTVDEAVGESAVSDEFELTANGPDFHLGIAQSLGDGDDQTERVTAQLLEVSLSSVQSFETTLLGLVGSEFEGESAGPELWFSRDGEEWGHLETTVFVDGERSVELYSWDLLYPFGPLFLVRGSVDGDVWWFTSEDALSWERLEISLPTGVVIDRPLATTTDSVVFAATNPDRTEPQPCTNIGPELFLVEIGVDDGDAAVLFEDEFLISQRLNGSFPMASRDGVVGALDVAASFGEVTPCAGPVSQDRLVSSFLVSSIDSGDVDSFELHDKLAFGQRAFFRGSATLGEELWFVFSDSGSVSLLNQATGEWRVVTSPVFADFDVSTDGWLSTSGQRIFFTDNNKLIAVTLLSEAAEPAQSRSTFTMSDEVLVSLQSVEVLWASDDQIIFATGASSWLVEAPSFPSSMCTPEFAEDRGGVGVARQICSEGSSIGE